MALFDSKKTTIKITVDTELYNAYLYHTRNSDMTLEERVVEMMRAVADSKQPGVTPPPPPYTGTRDGEFRKYLVEVAGKSYGTSNSYRSAVNCFCKIVNQNFWEANAQQVNDEYNKWKNMPEFQNAPLERHATLSNGVKRYIEFLRWKEANN